LEPAAGDDVCRPCVLGHVQRIFVAHVDDGRADFYPAGPRTDGRKEGKWRAQLPGEMMHAKVGTVGAQFIGGYSQLD
jgi:hypothetical protein